MPCGPPCEKLTPLARRYHLLRLEQEAVSKDERLPAYLSYREASPGTRSDEAAEANAARLHRNAEYMAAMAYHHRTDSRRLDISRESVLRDLLPIAATGRVKTSDLVTVRARPKVSREELEDILDLESDGERAERLRRLLQVQILPWEGEGAIDPELTRGVSVEQRADGTLKIVPPPLSASLGATRQIRELLALDKSTPKDEAWIQVADALADAARVAKLTPEQLSVLVEALAGE